MYYRPEIDGLRSFAIIPVVLFHAGFSLFSGGYLGVDVFFVISGYLITSILMKNAGDGQLSILKFYEKRARRILPALFLIIFAVSVVYPFINNHPSDLNDYGLSILSVLAFSSNIYFWTEAGYFGTASEMTPLLHTWSLAVEEQFYIFLPLAILFFYARHRKVLGFAFFIVVLISLGISEWGARNSSEANFYLLPSRVWELFVGALCALYYSSIKSSTFYSRHGKFLSCLSLSILVTCFFTFDSETLHPSILTLIPVLSVAAILLFSEEKSLANYILTQRFLIIIGLLSYSIYLWHQPILVVARTLYGQHLSILSKIAVLSVTLSLSWVSWKYVEAPYRHAERVSNRRLIKHIAIAALISLVLAVVFLNNTIMRTFFEPVAMTRYSLIEEATNINANAPVSEHCHVWSPIFDDAFIESYDRCAEQYGKSIFILGGSHGMDFYNVLSYASESPFVVSVSRGFCRLHKPLLGKLPHKCQYEDFLNFLKGRTDSISLVIYTQTGDRLIKGGLHDTFSPEISESAVQQVVEYMAMLKNRYALDVLIVGTLPTLNFGPKKLDYRIPIEAQLKDMHSPELEMLADMVDAHIERTASEAGVKFLRKTELFQLTLPEDLFIQGKLTYSDSRHLSRFGASAFARRITSQNKMILDNKQY